MLVCVECERVFEQPRHVTERHGQDTPPYEQYDACPFCGGTNIHPARTCDVCGKWLTGGYIKTLDGQRVCGDCYTAHDVEGD